MSFDEFEYEDEIQNKLRTELEEAKQLLKKAVDFMNLVPNNTITVNGEIADDEDAFSDVINHYELCSRVDKFLKE